MGNKIRRLQLQAERIDKLTKNYDGISWKKIKELIPKVSNFKKIIEETINEEGEIVKGAQFLEVWRKAYSNLGKENTMEDKKGFDAEFKLKIETDLRKIEIMEQENKEKIIKKKERKKKETIQL